MTAAAASTSAIDGGSPTAASPIPAPAETEASRQQRRSAKKTRTKQKLATYRENSTHLRTDCEALQSQLVLTAQRLQEVDSRAALKVDTLQSELRETSAGMEVLAAHKAQESVEQAACVKSMGKKLIKQVHVV